MLSTLSRLQFLFRYKYLLTYEAQLSNPNTAAKDIQAGAAIIMISDAGELEVRRADDDRILAAGKLSTGTKEQLYLAMRLAALDHLDRDRERLPVFIDEALVNWDAARRGRGFQLLRELSQTRQVFVMTCHERWAEELIDAGAKRVDLT